MRPQEIIARFELPREDMGQWRKAFNLVGLPVLMGVIAALLTFIFDDKATVNAIVNSLTTGMVSLITVNAVIVGLTYATIHTAASFVEKTEERTTFALGVFVMVTSSMTGVFLGLIYVVWTPPWGGLVPLAVFFLVSAPAIVPSLASQEHRARRAESERSIKVWLQNQGETTDTQPLHDEADLSRSAPLRIRRREFLADPTNPFEHDLLGREPQVRAFCAMLASVAAPAVVSLDAGWGAGKTAFVKMCAAWMQSDEYTDDNTEFAIVEFNAWTQNHTENALTDIVAAVTDEITRSDADYRRKVAVMLRQQTARLASVGAMSSERFAYSPSPSRQIVTFKQTLHSYVNEGRGKLVVFVDELDRCRPDYAVAVLEKLRHMFNVQNVLVVIALNRRALERSVVSMHGLGRHGR